MGKLRIYELAKELGVDNKVVIDAAIRLGMQGKSSHSNSLEADEADQIRRTVIRQAIGSPGERETLVTRVDKSTGESTAVVERRKGNVIRRRKEADAPILEAQPEPMPAAALEAVEELEAPVEEAEVEAPEEAQVGEAAQPPSAPQAAPVAVEEEKKAGPKVLGRISLPVKKAPKPEKKKMFSDTPAMVVSTETEEEGEGKPAKKRSKKREFSRTDLVDYDGRGVRKTGKTKKGADQRDSQSAQAEASKPVKRIVKMGDSILVGDLARQMSLKAGDVISKLIQNGVMATINQAIDKDIATIIAEEYGCSIEYTTFDESTILNTQVEDSAEALAPRPPVVTVMGHVDHGKTSLLDSIRKTSVAAKEHGGITQHIGAYSVVLEDGRRIAFIDTPGHAAFTAMRARGANVTDIVVLVVAADDGVMPQTVEAINHAKAANVPIVVAVNKCDKPDAKPDRVKQQLAEYGVNPEDWGGDTMFFNVSATKGTGITELLDGILLVAEVKELRANPDRKAQGTIIEAQRDLGRGVVATVLVQRGTLKVGDVFVAGAEYGRVRSMTDENGKRIESAGPSTPVGITGLNGSPEAGDDFLVVDSEADARQVTENRQQLKKVKELREASGPISLEEFSKMASTAAAQELVVIVKADVHGSLEAVKSSLDKIATDKVRVRVVHSGIGGITESDVQLAIASRAIIIGFGVRAEPRALADAQNRGVDVRFYRIIYELLDDVKKAMAGMLAPIKKEVTLGHAEVRNTFTIPKIGTVAGCYVQDGMIKRGSYLRLLRDSKVVYEGKMGSLRRFKDDVREVQSGYECGISVDGYNDVKPGDTFEVYEIQETAATLE